MIIDCHVHICAMSPARGGMSPKLLNSLPFRFMRWRLGMKGTDEQTERDLEAKLAETINETTKLDAAVVLAFDAVHDREGRLDQANTHLYVKNDYVIELSQRNPKMRFGASVHPYRKDAVAELERCVAAGLPHRAEHMGMDVGRSPRSRGRRATRSQAADRPLGSTR